MGNISRFPFSALFLTSRHALSLRSPAQVREHGARQRLSAVEVPGVACELERRQLGLGQGTGQVGYIAPDAREMIIGSHSRLPPYSAVRITCHHPGLPENS